MKIIAGLGNPAAKYEGTRHNTGFAVIDRLAEKYSIRVNTNRPVSYTHLADQPVCAGKAKASLSDLEQLSGTGQETERRDGEGRLLSTEIEKECPRRRRRRCV